MILDDLVSFLKGKNFNFSKFSDDGRINSAVNESEIINLIKRKFNISQGKKREWFDFSYDYDGIFYPVNLKITELSTDNLNCKLGIYYALVGKIPNFDNQIGWDEFLNNLSKNICKNNADYYFLIINKNCLKDIFWTSLKQIHTLVPNGNNLPFQANWEINKRRVLRNYNDAKEMILYNLGFSLKLRAKAYNQFLEYFPEFKDKF